MALSKYADWWDEQKRISEKFLMEWVDENPQWWAVGVATAVQTAMDLGAGTVDVLRFGEGMAEGGVKGLGKDALRLLVLLGPLGRAGGFLSRVTHVNRLRFAVQVKGVTGPCTFQAVNNAASVLKGKNLFLTVRDMAKATGKPLKDLERTPKGAFKLGSWIDDLVPFLQKHMKVREVYEKLDLKGVIELARKENGVTVFAIHSEVTTATGAVKKILHTVIGFRRPNGAVGFADYGGRICNSLEDLVKNLGYGSPNFIKLYEKSMSAAVMQGMNFTGELAAIFSKASLVIIEGLTAIETTENGAELAVPASMTAVPDAAAADVPPEVVKGSFDSFAQLKQGKKVIRLPEIYITAGQKVAPRPEYLTGVQFRLNALGFGAGPVDGKMGPKTEGAVRKFQKTYPPLRIDGVPGAQTQAKLVEVCGY